MSDIAIQVENLSKQYQIGVARHDTLRDALANIRLRSADRRSNQPSEKSDHPPEEMIWALKDVSFEVQRGEVVGVIGRNGAGKSTLLKILSRITEPTHGRAVINGRVGSLLEVGTGFHPELTGRENIYLNGAILGMRRTEINKKFDEIVAFSEIEKFLDTPVKRYSSGMYVRLAFAVAAHLEPEILLVDEVLAVGDSAFQKKCLGKMGDVAQQGRTVLFVSHNMAAISSLCGRAIVLHQGEMIADQPSNLAIKQYLDLQSQKMSEKLSQRQDRRGDGRLRFTDAWIEDQHGNRVEHVVSGQDVRIVATYAAQTEEPLGRLSVAFSLHGPMGQVITDLVSEGSGFIWEAPAKTGKIVCKLNRLPLKAGQYSFNVFCRVNQVIADFVQDAGVMNVEDGDFYGTGRLPAKSYGQFLFEQQWDLVEVG